MRAFRQDDTCSICTDMTGNAGQHINIGTIVEFKVKLSRRPGDRQAGGECEGSPAQFGGVNSQHEMMHDRIANQDNLENVGQIDFGFCRHLARQVVQGFAHNSGHFLVAAGVHHHVGDPAHQVFTEADLRVHQSG